MKAIAECCFDHYFVTTNKLMALPCRVIMVTSYCLL